MKDVSREEAEEMVEDFKQAYASMKIQATSLLEVVEGVMKNPKSSPDNREEAREIAEHVRDNCMGMFSEEFDNRIANAVILATGDAAYNYLIKS